MDKIAIVTILFDYPNTYVPIFESKLLKEFNKENYFVIRYQSENDYVKNESYYFKFTHFRIKNFVRFVEEKILNFYDYFILLDATDVGYCENISSVPTIMEEYGCNILFGAERNLWPPTDYSYLYENKKVSSFYKFLNAGVFCAKPQYFISHVENIVSRKLNGLCDQGNWQIEYLLSNDIELDYKNKLVLNTYLAKNDIEIIENEVNFKTNTPIFIHDNGGYNDETIKLSDYFI